MGAIIALLEILLNLYEQQVTFSKDNPEIFREKV